MVSYGNDSISLTFDKYSVDTLVDRILSIFHSAPSSIHLDPYSPAYPKQEW